jgi:hypothetical protein
MSKSHEWSDFSVKGRFALNQRSQKSLECFPPQSTEHLHRHIFREVSKQHLQFSNYGGTLIRCVDNKQQILSELRQNERSDSPQDKPENLGNWTTAVYH